MLPLPVKMSEERNFRLYKREKLCSVTAIDRLFAARPRKGEVVCDAMGKVGVYLCFPLRMVYGQNPSRGGAPVQFLISVPKKRLRRAVDRVKMRRRVREAYRLNRHAGSPAVPLDVAFIYVADKLVPYARVEKAVRCLLEHLDNFSATLSEPSSL